MIVEEVRLWKLTRRHVRERLEQGLIKGAILPTDSTEQHNEHLAMEHDTASAAHVAHQAALQLYPQTVVAPPAAGGGANSTRRPIRRPRPTGDLALRRRRPTHQALVSRCRQGPGKGPHVSAPGHVR
ncbi:MAG: creatininase family protein [Candidatus Latescibacterota bacterium]|nr:creatininase family protein [Candidatus Latescibacterota bacterium]